MTIQILPELLVNRIAAGEVIVRPASVVKELLENAIDAGATRVAVEIGNACRDITVRDDGQGISRPDAALVLVRHATSKITQFDDLYDLGTRGFRGEALASIASVARVQILTRRKGDIAGTRITAEGPAEPRIESAGAPEGTEIRVRELFFNTPPRLKFLKSPASELNQILQMVTRQAFVRPDIGFSVTNEKGMMFDLPPGQDWTDRVASLLGGGVREHLLDVDEERHGVHVTGFVLRPAASRKDRRNQYFFVNGRPIASRAMSFVLQQAYKGVIMVQRYPVCVLNLTLPPGEVDLNVHPTKEEVRFRSESLVHGVLHRVVHGRLQRANLMPTVTFGEGEPSNISPDQSTGTSPSPGSTSNTFHGIPQQSDMLPDMGPQYRRDPLSTIPVDFSVFTRGLQSPSVMPQSVKQQSEADSEFKRVEQESRSGSPATEAPPVKLPPLSQFPSDAADGGLEESSDNPGTNCSVRPIQNSLRRIEDSPEDAVNYALLRDGTYPEPLGQISRCYILAPDGLRPPDNRPACRP